jgi:flagellar biosynthesis protein FlhA
MKASDPAVVEEMKLAQVSIMDLHRVLVALVEEGVPITDVVRIAEAVTARARLDNSSTEALVEAARAAVGSRITADRAKDGRLALITLDAVYEQSLLNGVKTTDHGSMLSLDPAAAEHLIGEVRRLFDEGARQGRDPVLVVAAPIRPAIARLLAPAVPRLAVLAVTEIGKQVQLDRIGVAHAATAVGV